jgi:hypothetical protein
MTFPAPVPELPAANVEKAAAYYVNMLGFTFDWGDDQGGIAGISRGNCRLFITNRTFRKHHGNIGPVLFASRPTWEPWGHATLSTTGSGPQPSTSRVFASTILLISVVLAHVAFGVVLGAFYSAR